MMNEAHSIQVVNVGSSSFIAAQEDIFNGDPSTDVVLLKNYGAVLFNIQKGDGATGTATIVAYSCDNAAGDNPVAIAAKYRTNTSGDAWSDWLDLETTGFTTTAGADQQYQVLVDADDLASGDTGVYLTLTEVVDSPCDGSVVAIMCKPRYAQENPLTAIA